MHVLQKMSRTSGALAFESAQQPDRSWQAWLEWKGRRFVGSPKATVKAARQSAAREVLVAA